MKSCPSFEDSIVNILLMKVSTHIMLEIEYPFKFSHGCCSNKPELSITQTVTVTVDATGDFVVDWGDGAIDFIGGTSHTYRLPGNFTIKGNSIQV